MAVRRSTTSSLAESSIIAESPIMQKVLAYAANIACSDSAVIIYGESGAGKKAMAQYIYTHSARKDSPFLVLNCASLAPDQIDLALWGGAGQNGVFAAAHNGTLLLEDIGTLPFSAQINLCNAIRRRTFRRPGSGESVPCDVRILVSSQKNLKELVDAGIFFDNLYYSLSVFLITVPPLRQRKEDIIPLAHWFLEAFNEKSPVKKRFEPETLYQFKEALWPGNIRELHNVVERMYTMAPGEILRQDRPAPDAPVAQQAPAGAFSPEPENLCLKLAVEDFEKQFIQYVIAKCHGNLAESARQMGIHRTGLYKKLEKYSISIVR